MAKESKIKILFIIRQLGRGGTERRLIDLSNVMKKDYDVKIFSMVNIVQFNEDEGLDRNILIQPSNSNTFSRIYNIIRILRDFKPDIVHCFDIESGVYYAMANKFAPGKRKFISGYGGSRIDERRSVYFLSKAWTQPDLYVCNSHAGASVLKTKIPSFVPIEVIYNGLDVSRYDANKEIADNGLIPENRMVIGYIGKMDNIKCGNRMVDLAQELFEHSSEPYFIAMGGGPNLETARQKLSYLPEKLNQNIHLPGQVKNAAHYSRLFTVGVLVSETEGLPNAILEYMSLGIPWVSTDVGDVQRLNEHGQSGFVISGWNVREFSEKIQYLLENPSERERMGKTGKEVFLNHFTISTMGDLYKKLYQSLLT